MAKILVIDDEPGIRDLLDTLLRRKGYDVVLAENGQKGLDLFRRTRSLQVLEPSAPSLRFQRQSK